MTIRYVGIGGNDANDGLSWANRKLTLNGAEDTPVVAGDTVYVGPGTYREELTCDVSGETGSAISYIGDYDGTHTDGVGGVVRITGSDDDIAQARQNCVYADAKNYRVFRGFYLDGSSLRSFFISGCTNWSIDACYHCRVGNRGLQIIGASTGLVVNNNIFVGGTYLNINFEHSSFVNDSNNIIQNCIFIGPGGANGWCINIARYGGITVKNCIFNSCYIVIRLSTIPDAGQTNQIYNCIIHGSNLALYSPTPGFLVEDYNNFTGCETNRTNVAVGEHSNSNILLYDPRWFYEMVAGGRLLTPHDMYSQSTLIDVAGTSPTTEDMRGTTVQGAQREWGALEYDSALAIEAGGGGAVRILPLGKVGL